MKLRLLLDGMNQNKQKGMLSKDHLDKYLVSNGKMELGDDIISLKDKKWYINDRVVKFTQIYQLYRSAYKSNLLEGTNQIGGITAKLDKLGIISHWVNDDDKFDMLIDDYNEKIKDLSDSDRKEATKLFSKLKKNKEVLYYFNAGDSNANIMKMK